VDFIRDEVTGENCIIIATWFVLFTKYYYEDHTNEDEMGEACSAHG
jgi:hypothetical protein